MFGFVCLFVCLSACLSVRSITQKRMIPTCSNLVYGMTVRYPRWLAFGVERSEVRSQVSKSIFHTTASLTLLTFARWHHQSSAALRGKRRVQTTTAPGFCSRSLERSQARHHCSRGSEPVTWIGGSVIIFAPARCCYMTSYLTLCWLICCNSFIAWILPELWKRYSLWVIVGCKLYKVCFCSPIFCQELELVIRYYLERSIAYSLRSLHRDWNTEAIQRDWLLSLHVSGIYGITWATCKRRGLARLEHLCVN